MGPTNPQAAACALRSVLFSSLLEGAWRRIRQLCRHFYRLYPWLKQLWTWSKRPPPRSINSTAGNVPATATLPYTIVNNGALIPLDGVATSLHPASNDSEHNASRLSDSSMPDSPLHGHDLPRFLRRASSLPSPRLDVNSCDALPCLNTDRDTSSTLPWSSTLGGSPILPSTQASLSYELSPNAEDNAEEASHPSIFLDDSQDLLNRHDTPHDNTTLSEKTLVDPEARYVRPAFPSETQRYDRQPKIPKVNTNMTFPPITLDYSKPAPPDGWERYAHPEGCCYFYNKILRVYTDAEIYDPVVLAHLEADIAHLKSVSTTFQNPFPPTGEFVINVYWDQTTDDNSSDSSEVLKSEYYCVDHATRLIFFLKDFRSDWMDAWYEAPGGRSKFHLQHELLAQYWFFVQLYPSAIELTADMIRELRDIVVFHVADTRRAVANSTACYPLETLHHILTLSRELAENIGPGSHGSMCALSRELYLLHHLRFINFHGEPYARLERDLSVYDNQSMRRRSVWMKITVLILFSAPVRHLDMFHTLSVDGIVYGELAKARMGELNNEWKASIVLATLLLNANVAFLAIQSVDVGGVNPYRSPTQISSYISAVANFGSIILGLVLIHWGEGLTTSQVTNFLHKRTRSILGLESLAVLYSVPYALLIWGLIAFAVAFSTMCFQNSNMPTRTIVGAACFLMSVPILCWVYISWDHKTRISPSPRPLAYFYPNESRVEVIDGESDDKMQNRSLPKALLASIRCRTMRLCSLFNPRTQINDIEVASNAPAEA